MNIRLSLQVEPFVGRSAAPRWLGRGLLVVIALTSRLAAAQEFAAPTVGYGNRAAEVNDAGDPWRSTPSGRVFRPDSSADSSASSGLPLPAPRPRGGATDAAGSSASPWMGLPTLGKTAMSLGIVVSVLLIVAWAARKKQTAASRPHGAIEMLERQAITARQHLQLIRVGERVLLLSISPNECRTLTEINDPIEVQRLSGRRCDPGSALPEILRGVLSDDQRLNPQSSRRGYAA